MQGDHAYLTYLMLQRKLSDFNPSSNFLCPFINRRYRPQGKQPYFLRRRVYWSVMCVMGICLPCRCLAIGIDLIVFYKVTGHFCGNNFISTSFSFVLRSISLFPQVYKPRFTEQVNVAATYIWECSLRNRVCINRKRYINIVLDFRIRVIYCNGWRMITAEERNHGKEIDTA
jgi:hypothetical protein